MGERHKHADLIHAWAEGADIQIKRWDGKWLHTDIPSWFTTDEYRVASKIPDWCENIPAHGVLCWVSDTDEYPTNKNTAIIINGFIKNNHLRFCSSSTCWQFATPLTNDEIKQFFREDAS